MTLTVAGLQWLERAILVYFALMNSAYLIFSVVAAFALIAHQRRVRSRAADVNAFGEAAFRPISVIVPARNEEATIAANVRALLTMRYPEFEIVVVSDGSTDHTLQVLRDAFDLVPAPQATRRQLETNPIRLTYVSRDHMNLRVIDKVGGGKSDALNAGLNAAKYPFVCNIDADSLLEPDALLRVARILGEDEDVDAVGGIIRVLNGSTVKDGRVVDVSTEPKPIVLCQTLEYLRGFLAGRTALGAANSLLIISGAFGVFRKKALFEAGGYSVGTVCEDMELIVRLHRTAREGRKGGKILFVPDPVCWTQVPTDWRFLLAQRDRWQRGLIESLWMHRAMFMNPRYGAVGLFGVPFFVFFEAFGPVIEAFGYVLVPVLWFMGLLSVPFATLFVILAILYGTLISLCALVLDDLLFRRYERPRDIGRLIAAAFLEYLGYRQVLALRRAASFISVFVKRGWGHTKRQAIAHGERTAPANGGPAAPAKLEDDAT